jgi:AraC-like DNA-binding protein
MPRGGLQIIQPAHLGENWVKPYSTDFHTEDWASWRAIIEDRPVSAHEAWAGGFEASRYYRDFLNGAKPRSMVAAPVKSPLFPGYDGALHVYASAEGGAFTDSDVKSIGEAAEQIGRAAEATRNSRLQSGDCANPPSWLQRTNDRVIVFNSNLKPILGEALSELDEHIVDQLHQDARHRLQRLGNRPSSSDRVGISDSRGQLWIFRAVVYRSYPALGSTPVLMYCLLPTYCDWIALRAADVAADSELSRLVPAIQFMNEHFRRGPTLGEIAKYVHLSPFHFHRRFTELLGITPKHFLLECQIFYSKRLLFGRSTELAEISKVCGFAHQSHFTSRFKQSTGLTPTRWRKQATKSEDPARGRVEVK